MEETESAQARYAESRQREDGASDFLTLLDAERTRIQAIRAFDQARATTATSLLGLYKALAGGF
jgi:outer membrane protein, multidrug efflux system